MAASNPELNEFNNEDSATTTVAVDDSLSITKLGPDSVSPGQAIAYQIVVGNSGPSDAPSVVVSDTLPASLVNAIAAAGHGSCTVTANLLTCSLGTIVAGETALIVVNGYASDTASGILVNTAQVTSAVDPTGAQSTVTTTLQPLADLALDVGSTPTVVGGEPVTVTYTVVNNGPSTAENVVVTATFPPDVTPPPGWVPVGGSVYTQTVGSVAPGETKVLTAVVTTDAAIEPGSSLQFDGVTSSSTSDPNTANNIDNADTSIIGLADLILTKSGPPAVTAGEGVTYTIVVNNAGPSTAQSVDVKDTLPQGVTYAAATVERSGGGLTACASAICQVGDMAVGETLTLTVSGVVAASVAENSVLTNTATVFSDTPDPNEGNNSDTHPVTVESLADLHIVKRAEPEPAVPGTELTYIIDVGNSGPSDAVGVTVSDVLPVEFLATSVNSSQGNCTILPCTLGPIPIGGSASVVVVGTVTSDATGVLTNTARVTSTTPLTNEIDDQTTITTTIFPVADLALDVGSTPTVVGGEPVTVTYTVVNNGPSTAENVVVTATFPSGVTPPPGWMPVGGSVYTQTVGSVAPGETKVLTAVVTTDAGLEPGSSLQFDGVTSSSTSDPDAANNVDNADTSIIGLADLILTKSGPLTVTAGQGVTYTVVVSNAGPSTAQSVDVKDTLPQGVTYAAATVERSGGGLTACASAICQVGDMAVGETLTLTVSGTVAASVGEGSVLTNTATVFSDTPDPNEGNNSDTHPVTVETLAKLRITKRDSG